MNRRILSGFFAFLPLVLQAQTYTGTGGPIPDDGTIIEFPLTVSGLSPATIDTATFGLESVCVTITHTWDSDLQVTLVSPDGTSALLFEGVGGDGDNFTYTCFLSTVSVSITSGTPPFTGLFKPMGILGQINNGQNGNGIWKLRILDTYAFADAGTLISWNITFGNTPATYTTFKGSNLPLVIINTGGASIPDGYKIPADLKIIDNGPGIFNFATDTPAYEGSIGISVRGNFSAILPQKPYNFETRDSFGAELDTNLLGMPDEHDWILLANYNDKVFVRNSMAFEMFRRMGHYAPRTRHCEVLLNGEYMGIYVFTEKIKRDGGRVNIKKLDSLDIAGIDLTGGYIFKNDYHDASNSWLSPYHPIDHPTENVYFVYSYPDPDNILPVQKNYIRNYVTTYESTLYGTTWTDPVTGYRAYIDVPSFMDYMMVNEMARNIDGFRKSCYYHKDRDDVDSRIHAGPVWDFDWAWKNIPGWAAFEATDGSGWAYTINDYNPDVNSPGWYVRFLQDITYQNDLKCRWENFRTTVMDTTWMFHYTDSVAALLDTAQQRHYERWPILGINVGTPEVDPEPATWTGTLNKFKNWVRLRLTWLDANMPGTCLVGTTPPLAENALRVFPNPASDKVFIESNAHSLSISLTDLSGKVAIQGKTIHQGETLDVSQLPAGLYVLHAQMEDGRLITSKLEVLK